MFVPAALREDLPYVLQGYEWDERVKRYRSDQTGRFVARARILNLVESSTADRRQRLAAGIDAVMDGRISPSVWYARTTQMLRRDYIQHAALASGGWDRLSDAERLAIQDQLRQEFGHLRQMALDIRDGKLSVAQAHARMDQYVGRSRAQYFVAERKRLPRAPDGEVTIERRELAQGVKHCPECVEYHARGWQPEGQLPLPTEQCSCRGHCYCRLTRRTVPASHVGGWIGHRGGPGDEMIDAGFGERAREYDPDQPRAPRRDPQGGQRVVTGVAEGGPGSGHWGHAGRPGEVGGSRPGDVATSGAGSASARASQAAAKAGTPYGYVISAVPSTPEGEHFHRVVAAAGVSSDELYGHGVFDARKVVFADGTAACVKVANNDGEEFFDLSDEFDSADREEAAFRVSQALGVDLVPPTVLVTHEGYKCSAQRWVEGMNVGRDGPPLSATAKATMRAFDVLISNGDRHGGNFLVDPSDPNHIVLIDHGLAFTEFDQPVGVLPWLQSQAKNIDPRLVEGIAQHRSVADWEHWFPDRPELAAGLARSCVEMTELIEEGLAL